MAADICPRKFDDVETVRLVTPVTPALTVDNELVPDTERLLRVAKPVVKTVDSEVDPATDKVPERLRLPLLARKELST